MVFKKVRRSKRPNRKNVVIENDRNSSSEFSRKSSISWAERIKNPPKKNEQKSPEKQKAKNDDNVDDGTKIYFNHSYILWAHDISEKDWSINGYKKLCKIENVSQFWRVFNNFSKLGVKFMHFFLMKDGVEPIWEDPENRNGGICSFRIEFTNAMEIWQYLNIRLVLETLTVVESDINGVSISPKNNWAIIKIWNKDCNNDLSKTLNNDILEKYKSYSIKYKSNSPEY